MKSVTKIPRYSIMRRLHKDSLERSCRGWGCEWLVWEGRNWSLPLELVLPSDFVGCSFIGCSSSIIVTAAVFDNYSGVLFV